MKGVAKAFMDVLIKGLPKGRLIFEVYQTKTPKAADNFLSLCRGFEVSKGRVLSYKGCTFHKIIPFLMAQGGDILTRDGTSNTSIYGELFHVEQGISHDSRGILSLANNGPNTNGSQFFVTLGAADWLDDRYTAFGKLIEGAHVLNMIEYCGTKGGKPNDVVSINNCGVLI
eukprot:TRINITY_DN13117_c0_g1_i1.p1 TRINITY_DN13117_c0_g1~~TRINITY_DN13117_c0_g1_i1.p1  ORF type:complete len:171 (+),score=28.32 TRINITY_DN13117_c0_g1_i1:122-634(+)